MAESQVAAESEWDSGSADEASPPTKKSRSARRSCHFLSKWLQEFKGVIAKSAKGIKVFVPWNNNSCTSFCSGDGYVRCIICNTDLNISHGGRHDLMKHLRGKHHQEMVKASTSSRAHHHDR